MKTTDGAHECREEIHRAVAPEAIQRHKPDVDAAKVKGQAPVHSPMESGIDDHVNLVGDLKGNQNPSHLLQRPFQHVAFKASEASDEREAESAAAQAEWTG